MRFILAGILLNTDIYFARTSLRNTLVMVLIAGGVGLILYILRNHRQPGAGVPLFDVSHPPA